MMEPLTEKNIRAQLLDFLSNLQNVGTSTQRQALVDYTGFHWLTNRIIWEGNTLTFFGSLVNLIAQDGRESLLEFLDALAKSEYMPFERQAELTILFRLLASYTPEQWSKAFTSGDLDIQEIIKRFQKASALEKRIVGSKYIRDLYFPRLNTEVSFKRFLESGTTCFLIVAKAGRGKTNLMCRIVEELQDQRPILFLSGRVEPKDSDDILKRIAGRLGYGENWSACFEDLGTLAENGLASLILIDGINESSANTRIMQDALHELLFQANSHKVKVCVTCRTDFWQFYRAPFWGEFSWRDTESSHSGKVVRGEDLPIFPQEDFGDIMGHYFDYFHIQGELVNEAWESCRNPLLLRFFCEAYRYKSVGIVSQIRLYGLFKLFWERKIENVQDLVGLREPHPIYKLVLTMASQMYQRHQTKVPREAITKKIGYDLTQPSSLYLRVLDEEIILEEEVDELRGTKNVIFVYDTFTEYAIALSIFSNLNWSNKPESEIVADTISLMEEETQQNFTTLRGALEFMVLRMEDIRPTEGIHFNIIKAMLDRDWKWRRIGTMLAFQLTHTKEKPFWEFVKLLTNNKWDFVRRICAVQLGLIAKHHPDNVLPLLNRGLQDDNAAVRQTAKDSLLHLDLFSAIQEAILLCTDQPIRWVYESLVAEILLWPLDSSSLLMHQKIRWLVKENYNIDIQESVIAYLTSLEFPIYQDIYVLEELEGAFQVDWELNHEPSNPYLETIHFHLVSRKEALGIDLRRLETARLIIQNLFGFTMNFLGKSLAELENNLEIEFMALIPNVQLQSEFLDQLERIFVFSRQQLLQFSQRKTFLKQLLNKKPTKRNKESLVKNEINLKILFQELISLSDIFIESDRQEYIINQFSYLTPSLLRLYQITNLVVREASEIVEKDYSVVTVHTEVGEPGLNLALEHRLALYDQIALEIGVELDAKEHLFLFPLGCLSLQIWQAEAVQQGYQQALKKRVEQISTVPIAGLQQRLSRFESVALSEEVQQDLSIEVQALCRLYMNSQPLKAVEVLIPLIIWINEHDSPLLSYTFHDLYTLNPDSFWALGNMLLEHEDQRVLDFASQMLEQAEYIEELGFKDVIQNLWELFAFQVDLRKMDKNNFDMVEKDLRTIIVKLLSMRTSYQNLILHSADDTLRKLSDLVSRINLTMDALERRDTAEGLEMYLKQIRELEQILYEVIQQFKD